MPEEERRIPVAVIIPLALGLGLAGVLGLAAVAWAAPAEVYTCPVCGAEFSTLEDLQYHFTTEHPREPIELIWG